MVECEIEAEKVEELSAAIPEVDPPFSVGQSLGLVTQWLVASQQK